MKKSRTGLAILFIAFLVVGFVVLVIAVSILSDDKEASTWAGILDSGNKIGVITLEGTLTSSDEILKQIKKFRKKSSVKAILLRVNSPGGTVAPAQEIYREIVKTRKKKPVVVSMETVAASAAYYIASTADTIVCSQGTITGSIGVIMVLPDIHKVIEKIGVDVNIIKAGKYKDIGSGVKPLSGEERNILDNFAAEVHEQFISDVARGREGKIDKDKLREIADGRFFTGEKAKEMGLVDTIGNFYDAVKIAAELGKITTEPELVYPRKKWDNALDLFMESSIAAINRVAERSRVLQAPSVQ
ncbi:MAG: signal peptide peptidase SppA [Desulfomonile tiedjei]|uniref:Signal peptide peptidase SppA n=1 Tax=Desulfomonile tiedjei TaxID=2358 RepID=A0A9D6V435_9BACT|nr:signal peptide peptidase SppA [Desulfomonile tiedjei]